MVAFSIAFAASVLFICIANISKRYIDYKYNKYKINNDYYCNKLDDIEILCNDVTERENIAKTKEEYFSISNYQELVGKIKYIIKRK